MAAGPGQVRGGGVVAVVGAAVGVSALALYGVWIFWPAEAAPGAETPSDQAVHVFWLEPTFSRARLFVVVLACAGVLGTLPRVLRSLATTAGNRDLRRRGVVEYAVALALAAGLGAVFALLASGRLDSPYWPAAVTALAGFLVYPLARPIASRW